MTRAPLVSDHHVSLKIRAKGPLENRPMQVFDRSIAGRISTTGNTASVTSVSSAAGQQINSRHTRTGCRPVRRAEIDSHLIGTRLGPATAHPRRPPDVVAYTAPSKATRISQKASGPPAANSSAHLKNSIHAIGDNDKNEPRASIRWRHCAHTVTYHMLSAACATALTRPANNVNSTDLKPLFVWG